MYRTIMIGAYISVQGLFVRNLPNGHIVIRVGKVEFSGMPVSGRRVA